MLEKVSKVLGKAQVLACFGGSLRSHYVASNIQPCERRPSSSPFHHGPYLLSQSVLLFHFCSVFLANASIHISAGRQICVHHGRRPIVESLFQINVWVCRYHLFVISTRNSSNSISPEPSSSTSSTIACNSSGSGS